MKIAIEAQRIFRTNKHGMDFVALETIRQIQKLDTENEYHIIVAKGDDVCLEESKNMKIIVLSSFGGYFGWEQLVLAKKLKKIKPDILHCTSNTAPYFINTKLILTLHDIIFLEKRDKKNRSIYQNLGRIYRRFIVPKIIPKTQKIITVSLYEKNVIKNFLNLNEEKIVAIYNGFSNHFNVKKNPQTIYRKYIDNDNYIFFLGNTDPKKNTQRTISAYAQYLEKTPKQEAAHLLIADLKEEIIDQILRESKIEWIKPFIHASGYISNNDLPYIYSGAKAFLYTSLRESFGIPILESMACGTPIITSNTSAIPEIAGEGAILVDPFIIEDISSQLIKVMEDKEYRDKQIKYGFERIKLFSWENTAKDLMKLYNEVGKS
ncbi:MAG: glycosyltransferase family 4 protein [Bacteroidales bacterium]|jgi:glycosyltransferase involved in cell wall biosynthesis|nr:glycosyltransferase family 4 protein [Bacteroidales bacterium]